MDECWRKYQQDIKAMMDDAEKYGWKLVIIKLKDLDEDLLTEFAMRWRKINETSFSRSML